jgi:tripartite-type tricarboxylate transporter receptor subunit TctC
VAGFEIEGTLRILAVTTAKRLDVLPDVPTIGEFLPGYEGSGWQGIVAPGTRLPLTSKIVIFTWR